MNILPFVAIFLTLLVTISYNLLDKHKLFVYEKEMIIGHERAERALVNNLHTMAFKQIPVRKKNTSEKNTPTKKVVHYSLRDSLQFKMNLFSLLQENTEESIEPIVIDFLQLLYGDTLLENVSNRKPILKDLLSEMIKTAKNKIAIAKSENKEPPVLKLHELYPQKQELKGLFYKMLKGTQVFHIGDPIIGYPPLERFFVFDSSKPQKILNFSLLSPSMLSLVFGIREADVILKKEEELQEKDPDHMPKILSKEELLSLIHQKFPTKTSIDKFVELFEFSTARPKLSEITICDPDGSIVLKKRISKA